MTKVRLTTTFEQLYNAIPCVTRYHHLAKALGGIKKYGRTTPINLLTILKHNGLPDFFWTLAEAVEGHQIVVDSIESEGKSWQTKEAWDEESVEVREERIAGIKRHLKL